MRVRRWLRAILATPSAVYGLVLYQALIAAIVGDEEETMDLWHVVIFSVLSLLIFFGAHLFAETVAAHGVQDMRSAFRRAMSNSAGMLISAIVPTLILVICAIVGTTAGDAEDWALLSAVVILGFLGYEAFALRGFPIWLRIIGGAFGTALLGAFVIFLNFLVH